jgi:HD-GYP domain-containing protein (c-di-GMP phosphodiesterase class II)
VEDLAKVTSALVRALRERDDNTGAHSDRTADLSLELGRACRLSTADLAILALAAKLHDVGKIGIPDNVLLKPGRLDAEELNLMRSHPRRGYDILTSILDDDELAVASVVLHHHEGFDGAGYPDRLKGEAIPVMSRIVAVADSYDAMATIRPYHAPRSHAEIMHVMFEVQGGNYDPYIRTAFATLVEGSVHRAKGAPPPQRC